MNKTPLVLLILDGWGFRKEKLGNAIEQGGTPALDKIKSEFPFALIQASGLSIGMEWGEAGNSEIGHMTIGAGRIIEQYPVRIDRAIKDKSFFSNPAFTDALEHAKKSNSGLHLAGLLTSGSVHSTFNHLSAMLELAGKQSDIKTCLHLFLDGKDSGLHEAPELLNRLNVEIKKYGNIKIATLIGRKLAMDRDNNWELTKEAYDLIVSGTGKKTENIDQALNTYYSQDLNDQTIHATVVGDYAGMSERDAVIFFNFREDSMRQLVRAFVEEPFNWFERKKLSRIYVATMTQYIENPQVRPAFLPPVIKNSLTEIISGRGLKQFHIAESEKYAHVTYFFNGLTDKKFEGETDVFIESYKDQEEHPAMRSPEIAAKVIEAISQNSHQFIVANFANGDILAHTGNLTAASLGVKSVDEAVGRIKEKTLEKDGVLVVTSDHGNAEFMVYSGVGSQETKHDVSPVPFYLVAKDFKKTKTPIQLIEEEKEITGILADIAPTILELMGLPKPAEVTGTSLLPSLTNR